MGPHGKNKLKKDVDKWLSKDPLIKKSTPTHVGVKPKKPNLHLDKSGDNGGDKGIHISGFLEPPNSQTGESNITVGVGTSNASYVRIQEMDPEQWKYFSGNNEVKVKAPISKDVNLGVRAEFNKNKKTVSPYVEVKTSISNLLKKKKNKPKDFGYPH